MIASQSKNLQENYDLVINIFINLSVSENNVIVCAICRVHCRSTNIIENQFLLEAGGESESVQNEPKTTDLKCTSCHDNSPATSWCVECSEYICDGCVHVSVNIKPGKVK